MKINAVLAATALLACVGAAAPAAASTATYSDRATYASQLATSVTDNYENPGYVFAQNDAQMSAVLGETTYTATGFANLDFVNPIGSNHFYCSGCNGTFELGFDNTSVSSGGGVFGVGFDLFANANFNALVTFADNTSALYSLPTNNFYVTQFAFWGITADQGIKSIYVGHSGSPGTDGTFGLDNLQIGAAPVVIDPGPGPDPDPGPGPTPTPEPGAWALMLAGFGALGVAFRRKRAGLAAI